ncbi:unnamed protein product [Alternaria alternata]
MPPKTAFREFDDKFKAELLGEMEASTSTGNTCMRCGKDTHGHINECTEKFSQVWSKGNCKFKANPKMDAEDWFQDQRARIIKERIQPEAENPAESGVRTVDPPIAVDTPSSSASGNTSDTSAKNRKLIETDNVGLVEYTEDTLQAQETLNGIPEEGLPDVATELVGSSASRGKLNVISNYVRVLKIPPQLHTYTLTFWRLSLDPLKPGVRVELKKRLELERAFNAMDAANMLNFNESKKAWATDFRSLWCDSAMEEPGQEDTEWDTSEFDCKLLDGRTYRVHATLKKGEVLSDVEKVLRVEDISKNNDYVRALNAYVAQCVRHYNNDSNVSITQLGANKFYLNRGFKDMFGRNNKNLGLRTVRGYYMSIRPGASGLLLNVNVATTAFLPPVRVSELLDLLSQGTVEKMLRGKRVRLAYRRQDFEDNKNAGFSINDELPRTKVFQQFGLAASEQKFFTVLGKDRSSKGRVDPNDRGTSVLKYFRDIDVRMPGETENDLRCVNVGKRIKSSRSKNLVDMREQSKDGAQWIPACLLEILPYQPMTGQMSPEHTTEMLNHALHLPAKNAGLIDKEGLRILGLKSQSGAGSNNQLVHMGFQLDSKLIRFAGKKLLLPRLVYKQQAANNTTNLVPEINEERASWNLQGAAFTKPGTPRELHVLPMHKCFKDWQKSTGENIRDDFIKQLKAHGVRGKAGYVTPNNEKYKYTAGRLGTELQIWFRDCEYNDCTVVLLNDKEFDTYATIKRAGDFLGHHTICAVASKIKNDEPGGFRWQHLSNMALKVNLKLGGDNHWLNDDDLNKVLVGELRNNTMILGSDVTHPGHGAKIGHPSIACVVGTVDARFMSYRGSMRLQAGGQEQIDEVNLCSMIMERLETWKSNNNGKLPTTILFYRDGVSESQFAAVTKLEIPQIKEAYEKAGGTPDQLSVCFLVVSKRHHTRFYAADKKASYESREKIPNAPKRGPKYRAYDNGNVKAGLLVDDIVTAPKPTNFFLQSHCAIKGTARSAHYYVLRNDTNISEANLQQLTMMLCYTFGRSTTGVSYATPAYVADRLCDRGRSYIRLWAENEYAKPVFSYKKDYDADGNELKLKDEDILNQKKDWVKQLLHSPVWGDNYQDDPNKPQRLNPWHRNLDEGMFWM